MSSTRRLVVVLVALACAASLAACSSSKKTTTTGSSSTTSSTAPITLTPPSSTAANDTFGAGRLFLADTSHLCELIDANKLRTAVGLDLQTVAVQGSACVFAAANGGGQVIVTVENGMPAMVLDSKLQLNGAGNVTVKEVTVSGAKRAVLETQPLPDQINQTLIALYDGGGVQLLISGKGLTDAKAIAAAEAVANS